MVPSFREKVWGSTDLEPWFPRPERKIGEVWFTGEHPLPILVKFLFTSDKLSVQVHPDDEYGLAHESSPGKTEMWYILRAGKGAKIALGFREPMTRERLRKAAISGEIEQLVRWVPVKPGEAYFTPAGTVHAIGGGIALCEIQQNSDITYRLYDYGRPRELHLEKGVEVANLNPHPGASTPLKVSEEREVLARCEYFVTESIRLCEKQEFAPEREHPQTLIFLEGSGAIGESRFAAGEAWMAPAAAAAFTLRAEKATHLLRTYAPKS